VKNLLFLLKRNKLGQLNGFWSDCNCLQVK
jgi:hypothetical protein